MESLEKISETDIETNFKNVINQIESIEQINIRGIKTILDAFLSRYENNNSYLYKEVKSYVTEIQETFEEHRENNFDNKTGVLNRLRKIRNSY